MKNLHKVITNQSLFTKNNKLLLAVSGGADSMALADVLFRADYKIEIAHVNYNLRANDSLLDMNLVKDWADKREIPFHLLNDYSLSKDTADLQRKAREIRYHFFFELLETKQLDYLLTAHHQDDVVETFFLHLLRGSGLKGLKSIEAHQQKIIRPFLKLKKEELLEYNKQLDVPFRIDKSNEQCDYQRNKIRNLILSPLNDIDHLSTEKIGRSIQYLKQADQFIEKQYLHWKQKHEIRFEKEIILSKSDELIFIQYLLKELEFNSKEIDKIIDPSCQTGAVFYNSIGHILFVESLQYRIKPFSSLAPETLFIDMPYPGTFHFGSIRFNLSKIEHFEYSNLRSLIKPNRLFFDFDKIKFPIQVRSWNEGDRIQILGLNGKSKKVQDVFTDKKIPLAEKNSQAIFISNQSIIAVDMLVSSELFKVDPNTQNVLIIERN